MRKLFRAIYRFFFPVFSLTTILPLQPITVLSKSGRSMKVWSNGQVRTSNGYSSSHRQVFLFENFVIKLDDEWNQNVRELNFYQNKLKPEDADSFPTLHSHGYTSDGVLFLVLEKVDIQDKQVPTPKQTEKLRYLKKKYNLRDMYLSSARDTHPYNHNVTPVGTEDIKIFDIGMGLCA